MAIRRLARSRTDGKIAGVCSGLADYFDVDVVLVRAAWVVLSIVPGAFVGGILAYVGAWLVMPVSTESGAVPSGRRLIRSTTDRKIAGVCGGLAEHFAVDATAIRLAWVIASIVFAAIVGGVIAYVIAWLIIPRPPDTVIAAAAPAQS